MGADKFRGSSRRDDCFWDFFSCESSILQKWNDRVQGNTLMDEITKVSQMCDSEVETNDDISELNFYESYDSSRGDTGEVGDSSREVGGSFNDLHQQLVVKSTEDAGGISQSFTDAEWSNFIDLHRQLVVKSTRALVEPSVCCSFWSRKNAKSKNALTRSFGRLPDWLQPNVKMQNRIDMQARI